MNDIEKAIDILKEKLQISTTGLTVGELNDQKRALDLAISVLEKQLNGCWISASERLPKEDEEVLVTTIGNQVCWAFRYLDEWNTCLSTFENEYVLAWMPLPEPYKEVENE
jgi:hypothetical protein